MRFFFHVRNKSVSRKVQIVLSVFRDTPQWSCQVAADGSLMAVKTPKRIAKKNNRPMFISLDSVDLDNLICENYIADENEHFASMQDFDDPWATCKGCHEIIDDCYC